MNLYDKYDRASQTKLGMSYEDVLSMPKGTLRRLLNDYNIGNSIDVDYCLKNMAFDRVVHIINVFLGGSLFFSDLIGGCILDNMAGILYEWELLALFHDISYVYENAILPSGSPQLKDVSKALHIVPFFGDERNAVFYSPETYERYFKYKREQFGVYDHGIIAGIIFHNRFHSDMLTQKTELSYVIASHNIFVANRNNVELYKRYGLQELIPDSREFISISRGKNKYAYFYMFFCLLDILEPINAFSCESIQRSKELLKTLDYEIRNNHLVIRTTYTNQTETIAHRVFDIPIWLNVGLNIASNKKIIISYDN